MKIFQMTLNKVLECCILDSKQQETKELVIWILQHFHRSTFSNLEIRSKIEIFYLILAGI